MDEDKVRECVTDILAVLNACGGSLHPANEEQFFRLAELLGIDRQKVVAVTERFQVLGRE